jgi:hypothetical protein
MNAFSRSSLIACTIILLLCHGLRPLEKDELGLCYQLKAGNASANFGAVTQ